ncbi:MAG: hypothetical protein IIB56_06860 [Planctomycetes bacterium]|nr:hypothetical protein [Planctomycetota bacterium]MCH8120401.1 hypothetical protein [Planctomycetota bacterium]
MNTFIEKNRRLLHFYCEILRTIGSLIFILGLVGGFAFIIFKLVIKFGYWHAPKSYEMVISLMPLGVFNIIFYGLAILGFVQFIRYLVEEDYQPGWILRHGNIFFYLYALFIILSVVRAYTTIPGILSLSSYTGVFTILMTFFSITVRVLILVGLGQILRRILPVIEESKTLV